MVPIPTFLCHCFTVVEVPADSSSAATSRRNKSTTRRRAEEALWTRPANSVSLIRVRYGGESANGRLASTRSPDLGKTSPTAWHVSGAADSYRQQCVICRITRLHARYKLQHQLQALLSDLQLCATLHCGGSIIVDVNGQTALMLAAEFSLVCLSFKQVRRSI